MSILKYTLMSVMMLYLIPSVMMVTIYFINVFKTSNYVRKSRNNNYRVEKGVDMLIVIPVLREQSIIIDTIKYFESLDMENINISLCFAGTKREEISRKKFNFKVSTKEVFEQYVANQETKIPMFYYEADDAESGDRATQLNNAVKEYSKESNHKFDIIGVFDADSRPKKEIFLEVASKYLKNPNASYQQPAFFINAANKMTISHENPLLIANALYQNTWSVISEIPMWVDYSNSGGRGKGNFYCIGHGEFFPVNIYKKFNFPEHEVTDGIQIGYRLAMCGNEVNILENYCNDDVPHDIKSIINQHKRWFGGCMRATQAESWAKGNNETVKKTTKFGIFWSQFRWAFTANLFIVNLAVSIIFGILFSNWIPSIAFACLLVIYSYILPLISLVITPIKKRVSITAIILIPAAIFIKGIGPNIYIFNRLFRKNNNYGKVER